MCEQGFPSMNEQPPMKQPEAQNEQIEQSASGERLEKDKQGVPPQIDSSQAASPPVDFSAGDRVRLSMRPPYFKTADPMPMLRPPDVIPVGEHGTIMERRPAGYWAVRFEQGSFLMEAQYLQAIAE